MNRLWNLITEAVWRVAVWDAARRRTKGRRVCNCHTPHQEES